VLLIRKYSIKSCYKTIKNIHKFTCADCTQLLEFPWQMMILPVAPQIVLVVLSCTTCLFVRKINIRMMVVCYIDKF
jgi:RNase P subunit RPR2